MKNKFSKIVCALLLVTGMIGCGKKGGTDGPQTTQVVPVTFKFGTDLTAITVDNAVQTIKNLPRSCDPTQLTATAVLPSGYSISPDPTAAKDYTKGVTYTVTTSDGKTFTLQITAPVYDAVNNPHGVYTPLHLSDMRNGLNDSYVLINDIQLPDMTASNAATVTGLSDYRDYGWYSIGARYVNGGHIVFRGSLDGQNHVIKNFTSTYRPGTNKPNGVDVGHDYKDADGLFGYAVRASFKNIGIQLASAGIADVTIAGDAYGNVGSLLGLGDSCTISNCYVTGNATITGSQYTGGLLGKMSNSTITKSYAALSAQPGSFAINTTGDGGGLMAWSYICTIVDCYASGSITGSGNIGGLIGAVNTCTIKTSYASGNVAELPLNGSSSLIASNNLGGLLGSVSSVSPASTIIQNCYATGGVAGANGSNTAYHKSTRIGGLIGFAANGTSGPVVASYCYATGTISRFWTSATAPFLTGALCGNTVNNVFTSGGSCTNYWDKTTTGQTVLGGGDGTFAQDNAISANGKTTAEMKASATYSNWDFSAVWTVAAGTNNGYPTLKTVAK